MTSPNCMPAFLALLAPWIVSAPPSGSDWAPLAEHLLAAVDPADSSHCATTPMYSLPVSSKKMKLPVHPLDGRVT